MICFISAAESTCKYNLQLLKTFFAILKGPLYLPYPLDVCMPFCNDILAPICERNLRIGMNQLLFTYLNVILLLINNGLTPEITCDQFKLIQKILPSIVSALILLIKLYILLQQLST
jgi:hypothetical protein